MVSYELKTSSGIITAASVMPPFCDSGEFTLDLSHAHARALGLPTFRASSSSIDEDGEIVHLSREAFPADISLTVFISTLRNGEVLSSRVYDGQVDDYDHDENNSLHLSFSWEHHGGHMGHDSFSSFLASIDGSNFTLLSPLECPSLHFEIVATATDDVDSKISYGIEVRAVVTGEDIAHLNATEALAMIENFTKFV